MSPPKRARVDPSDSSDPPQSYRVKLAADSDRAAENSGHERRVHRRRRAPDLRWIRQARLSAGQAVSIVDLSSGGALIDSPVPLRPDSIVTLEIEGRGFDKTVQFRVVRCQVGSLQPGKMTYRGAGEFTTSVDLPAEQVPDLSSEPAESQAVAWQKIVVRYVEGQTLKGFTHDFNPARTQFSLWSSPTAKANDRVIVPLARLKGVFFVRDFAGNPGYVERAGTGEPQHGRRIEVTLLDSEVIVGRTLNYRPDGYGFFVVPADPGGNNIRVFVVATAVRQVRFP